jgi:hypothetical protein
MSSASSWSVRSISFFAPSRWKIRFALACGKERHSLLWRQDEGVSQTAQGTHVRPLLHPTLGAAYTAGAHSRTFRQLFLGQAGLQAIPLQEGAQRLRLYRHAYLPRRKAAC